MGCVQGVGLEHPGAGERALRVGAVDRGVSVHHEGVEERRVPRGPMDLAETRAVVGAQAALIREDAVHHVLDRVLRARAEPHGHGVQCEAHHALRPGDRGVTTGHGAAENHIVASGQLLQHHAPRHVDEARAADAELLGARRQGGVELRVQRVGHGARHRFAQGGGTGHEGRLVEPSEVLAPGLGVRGGVPGGEMAQVLAEIRGGGQCGGVLARCGHEREQFLEEHGLGPRVREQVVLGDDQFARAVRQPRGQRADQRRALRVEMPVEGPRRRPVHLITRVGRGLVPRHGALRQQKLDGGRHTAVGEAGPQHGVAPVHRIARAAHGGEVHVRVQREAVLDHVGVRPGGAVHDRLEVHALLQRGQRQDLLPLGRQPVQDLPQLGGDGHGQLGGRPGGALAAPRALGQLPETGVGEHVRDGQRPAVLAQSGHEAQGGDAVPAETEEIVPRARPADAEQLVHRGAHGALRRGAGRPAPAGHAVRGGQCGAVDLAVGCHRQGLELGDDRRDHVVGEHARQCSAGTRGGGVPGWLRGGLRRVRRHHVAEQAVLAALIDPDARGRGGHARQRAQRGLDLAEFDPVPAHLDLVVHAAQEVQSTTAAHHEVTGAVQPGTRAGGVRDEARGRVRGAAQISAGHLNAAQVQFARHALGRGAQGVVEDTGVHAVPRHADRHATGPRRVLPGDLLVGHPHRRLGGPVHVAHLGAAREQPGCEVPVQGLTAHECADPAHVHIMAFGGVHETAPQRRRGLQDVRVRAGDHAQQRLGVPYGPAVREVYRAAHAQRREQFEPGDVERHGRDRHERIAVTDPAQLGHRGQERGDVRARHHHALGATGRTGGVQDVGQAVVRRRKVREGTVRGRYAFLVGPVQHQHVVPGRCGSAGLLGRGVRGTTR